MNSDRIIKDYDAPVISFSHFVPRAELMKATVQDELEIAQERYIMVNILLSAVTKMIGHFNITYYQLYCS